MSNRHRLPYAAFGGFLAVILGASLALAQEKKPPVLKDQPVSQGQKTPDKKGAKAESQKNTPPPEQLTPALRQIESAIRELVNQQRAAQEKGPAQHEIKDLKAQDDMALWAKLMFFATMVAVGITGLGVWLIKRTLDETSVAAKHTEGMLKEAKQTTEAAHAAIQATDKNAERQLRAYVHPSGPKLTMHEDSKFSIFLRFKNFGQTPAYDVIARTALTATPIPLRGEFPPPSDYPEKQPEEVSQGVIGPTQDVTAHMDTLFFLSSEYQSDIAAGKAAIFLYGEVKYRDAFDEPRVTSYRLLYTGPWGGEGSFKICPGGNDAT